MKKIIVFPGSAGVFFTNEIDYIKKYFDEIIVISYAEEENCLEQLAKEKKFVYYIIKNNIKSIFNKDLYLWLFSKEAIHEIRTSFELSLNGLKKLAYILYYGLFYANSKKAICKELESNPDTDIYLYSFWFTRGAYAIANYNATKNARIKKIVSRAHGYDLYLERNNLNYLPFRDFINENLDSIYFISDNGLKYHEKLYGNIKTKRQVSRLGTFNIKKHKTIKEKQTICIASCSNIIPLKRLDLIIDVISETNMPIEWIHIGLGELHDRIKAYAETKLTNVKFRFLGQVDNTKVLDTYIAYDVDYFINMSDSEGLPVSIMEAMSLGIPVIARNVGGISEIVSINTGLLIEKNKNLNQICEIINRELRIRMEDVEQYKYKSNQCIQNWKEKFDAHNNYNDFFQQILKQE